MRARSALLLLFLAVSCGERPALEAHRPPQRAPLAEPEAPLAQERHRMVDTQIETRGVRDEAVLAAMRTVPRHMFVPGDLEELAYRDRPLPIGYGQTISQPYIVASMTEELQLTPGLRVLEIGTGSGYQAAIAAQITDDVFTIEIVPELADAVATRLADLGYTSIRTRQGDGWHGWPDAAPFDAIIVTAASAQVPPPLIEQLAPGGRMIIPVGRPYAVQSLTLLEKDEHGEVTTRDLYAVRFVPFVRARDE